MSVPDDIKPKTRRKTRHWKRRASVLTYRVLRWAERYLPPGTRTLVGLLLMVGGTFGFLPVVGFWMFPLGIAVVTLDFPPLRIRMHAWLKKTRRIYHRLDRRADENSRNPP